MNYSLPKSLRLALIAPAVIGLICGLWSGFGRMGFPVPTSVAGLITQHGALMIGGFFGTLIGMERSVALGLRWPFFGPLLSGAATLCLVLGAPASVAPILMSAAAVTMVLACGHVYLQQRVLHHAALVLAALAWLVGNLVWLWMSYETPAIPLWATFLILTIAAERLELSRFAPTPAVARQLFVWICCALLVGAIGSAYAENIGLRIFAAALLALTLWLARYDIARRTIKLAGLTRYMAICLLSGYAWLGLAGVLGLCGGLQLGNEWRDATLHSLMLGFVFSMVFGHAPIILPAIAKLKLRWNLSYYLPLLVLHLGLTLRVVAGLLDNYPLRQSAAIANVTALILFVLTVVYSLITAPKPKQRSGT